MQNDFEDKNIYEEDYREEEEISSKRIDTTGIVVYSRDWTVETIINQIQKENISLYPKFQRRNVWNDEKRSKLIDSVVNNYPIPEIIISEHPENRNAYIVIDGKQRLMTLIGFVFPDDYNVWDNPTVKLLDAESEINEKSYNDFNSDYQRVLSNSSIRCTVITKVTDPDFLYQLFYRLNSGSVPLSIQELRQALYHGGFSEFLFDKTNVAQQEIHKVMRIQEPDKRLRDIEYILRIMAMVLRANTYTGDLKSFLDKFMHDMNRDWNKEMHRISSIYNELNMVMIEFAKIVGKPEYIGRQYVNGSFTRFNRVLFEVQMYYAYILGYKNIQCINRKQYINELSKLCNDMDFKDSITSSTKEINRYRLRYNKYGNMLSTLTGKDLRNPIK